MEISLVPLLSRRRRTTSIDCETASDAIEFMAASV